MSVHKLFDETEGFSWLDQDLWHDYKLHRKQLDKKRDLTPVAEKRLLAKLLRAHQEGCDVNAALEESIECGWKGVFPKPPEVVRQVMEQFKRPHITKQMIEQNARPGETEDQVRQRLEGAMRRG